MNRDQILTINQIFQESDKYQIESDLIKAGFMLEPVEFYPKILRKSIQSQNPIIINVDGKEKLIIGESPDKFYYSDNGDNGINEIQDSDLEKKWDGSGLLISEKPVDYIIYADERDTWGPELYGKRETIKDILRNISQVPCYAMPDHPVIILFKATTKEIEKKQIRAMSLGAEITIYDPSDPIAEICHEIGHNYYKLLNDNEIELLKVYQKKFKNDKKRPSIFATESSVKDVEEFFCTIYQWWLRKFFINPGYGKILHSEFPEGCKIIDSIAERIKTEKEKKHEWHENRELIKSWFDKTVIGRKAKIIGKGLKTVKTKIELPNIQIPENEFEQISQNNDRKWVLLKSDNQMLVLTHENHIDSNYMETKKRWRNIPVLKKVKTKNGYSDRLFYCRPEF